MLLDTPRTDRPAKNFWEPLNLLLGTGELLGMEGDAKPPLSREECNCTELDRRLCKAERLYVSNGQRANSRREHSPTMAQYQMYFGTQTGWTNFNVDIDEDEALQSVLPDVLRELEESGYVLQGWHEGSGELVVTWEGRELDLGKALPQQGLRPNEVLRVAVRAQKPLLQLRRENEPHDVVEREELREGDDIIVGRTILRFHISKQQKQLPENTTLVQRIRHAQIFHQTVYDMALIGGIAGLGCWSVVSWIPDFMTVGGGLVDVINMAVLGGFIGGLTVGCHDHWLEDRVVARLVLMGIVGWHAGWSRSAV